MPDRRGRPRVARWELEEARAAAVSHHKRSDEWKNDIDVALYKARDKILSDAASPERGSA